MSVAQGPVLVCGLGQFGYRAVELLLDLGEGVVVLTREAREEWRRAVEARGARVFTGDARNARTLEEAGLAGAKAVLAMTDADLVNIEIALDAKRLRPDLPVVVRLFDQTLARQLEQGFDIRRAIGVSTLAAPAFAGDALGERTLGAVTLEAQRYVLAKHTVDPASPLAGLPLREMAWRHRLEVVARRRASETGAELPDPDEPAEPGDQLFVLAEKADWLAFAHAAGRLEARRVRRRGAFRSALAAAGDVWGGTSRLLRGVLLVLLGLILVSVFVFSAALDLSLADAFYFVVSTVTTTGYGDITPRAAPLAVKLYGCLVMLIGSAALVAATSIVTAYVVAERFEALLGTHALPREDHVIVVGIGNVGYRTLEELVAEGTPAVAVDRDDGGDLFRSARAIAPAVSGDGRAEAVLLRAGVRTARAVVALTDDDAANLGIALMAKKLNPRARTVVRLFDVDFARKVERALDVDVAIGAATVAAPLFAAAALAAGVKAAFSAGSALVALLEETIGPEAAGRTPERLRADLGLHVLRVKSDGAWREAPRGEPLAQGTRVLLARRWAKDQ